jgi:hypothetical protein
MSDKTKKILTMLAVPLAFLLFSLIPWLIVANLLSYFRMSEEKGWNGLARTFEVLGLALAIVTAAWTVFGMVFWLVKLVRVVFDLDSKGEKHMGVKVFTEAVLKVRTEESVG